MAKFYPTISEQAVTPFLVVMKSLEADEYYLDDAECPYPDKVRDFFRKYGKGGGGVLETADLFAHGEETDVLDVQIKRVMSDLEAFSRTLGSDDVSEKLQVFKTKAALLEKLIGMRERVANLKQVHEFRGVIMAFMEEVLEKDQVADLMDRLKGTLGVGVE